MWRTEGNPCYQEASGRLGLSLLLAATFAFAAQAPPSGKKGGPQAGEAWVLREGAVVQRSGETLRERPIGSLAKLVWVRLAGADWEARGLRYTCRGEDQGQLCWLRSGHGELDFPSALRESCNLAFLAWARKSCGEWERDLGRSAALERILAAFQPFLAHGSVSPEALDLDARWVGDGQLLKSSPEGFAEWLAHPSQEALRGICGRLLAEGPGLWIKSGTAALPGDPHGTSAWAAGEVDGKVTVLYLPQGRGKVEGLARFRTLAEEWRTEEVGPEWTGDPEARKLLEASLEGAQRSTRAFGPWPRGAWRLRLHEEGSEFERLTRAPAGRAAAWIGATLHLRPWEQLKRRDLGRLLRHELTHRRIEGLRLRPWEEEARCLWAEEHTLAPPAWPAPPDSGEQDRLDALLRRGTPKGQAEAYLRIRAWLRRPAGDGAPKG